MAKMPALIKKAESAFVDDSQQSFSTRKTIHLYWALDKKGRAHVDGILRKALHQRLTKATSLLDEDGMWLVMKARKGEKVPGSKYLARYGPIGTKADGSLVYKYIYSWGELLQHVKGEGHLDKGSVIATGAQYAEGSRKPIGHSHIHIHDVNEDGTYDATDASGERRAMTREDIHNSVLDGLKGHIEQYITRRQEEVSAVNKFGKTKYQRERILAEHDRAMFAAGSLYNDMSDLEGPEDYEESLQQLRKKVERNIEGEAPGDPDAEPAEGEGGGGGGGGGTEGAGEAAPAEGEEAPVEGEEAPAEGEEAPAEGEEAPAGGGGGGGSKPKTVEAMEREKDRRGKAVDGDDGIGVTDIARNLHEESCPPVRPDLVELVMKNAAFVRNEFGEDFQAYKHQVDNVARALAAYERQAGFLLMDTAGTGKTITALMLLRAKGAHEGGRHLIVMPTSGKRAAFSETWKPASRLLGMEVTQGLGEGDGIFAIAYNDLGVKKGRIKPGVPNPGLTQEHLDELIGIMPNRKEDRVRQRADRIKELLPDVDSATATYTATNLDNYEELNPALKDFDHIIFDECHSMKGDDSNTARLGVELQQQEMGDAGDGTNILYMSATPFTHVVDAHYLRGLGMFRTGAEFADWAEAAGCSIGAATGDEMLPYKINQPDTPIPAAAVAAVMHHEGHAIRNEVDPAKTPYKKTTLLHRVNKHELADVNRQILDDANAIYDMVRDSGFLSPRALGGMRVQMNRRLWELGKTDRAIEMAKKELDEGRQVAMFVTNVSHGLDGFIGGGEITEKDPHGRGISGMLRRNAWSIEHNEDGTPRAFISPAEKARAEEMKQMAEHVDLEGKRLTELVGEPPVERMGRELAAHVLGIDSKDMGPDWREHVAQFHGEATDERGKFVGRGSRDTSTAEQQAFQSGDKRILIASSDKGGTGLSFGDTTGLNPRTQINLSMPWTSSMFEQQEARTHRVNSKSDTRMYWLHGDDDSEEHIASIVYDKQRAAGAAVHGDPSMQLNPAMRANFDRTDLSPSEQMELMNAMLAGTDYEGRGAKYKEEAEAEKRAAEIVYAGTQDRLRENFGVIDAMNTYGELSRKAGVKASFEGQAKSDYENRVGYGQLVAHFGARAFPDDLDSRALRLHPGDMPQAMLERLGAPREDGTTLTPPNGVQYDESTKTFKITNKNVFANLVKNTRVDADGNVVEVRALGSGSIKAKEGGMWAVPVAKAFAVPGWTRAHINEHFDAFGEYTVPDGAGGTRRLNTVDKGHLNRHLPGYAELSRKATAEKNAALEEAAAKEKQARDILGVNYERALNSATRTSEDRKEKKRANASARRSRKKVKKSGGAILPELVPLNTKLPAFVAKARRAAPGETHIWSNGRRMVKLPDGRWFPVDRLRDKAQAPTTGMPREGGGGGGGAPRPSWEESKKTGGTTGNGGKAEDVHLGPTPGGGWGIDPALTRGTFGHDVLQAHGGFDKVFDGLRLTKRPQSPTEKQRVVCDFSGDYHSHAVIQWRDDDGEIQAAYTDTFLRRYAAERWGNLGIVLEKLDDIIEELSHTVAEPDAPERLRDTAAVLFCVAIGAAPPSIVLARYDDAVVVRNTLQVKLPDGGSVKVTDEIIAGYMEERLAGREGVGRDPHLFDFSEALAQKLLRDSGIGSLDPAMLRRAAVLNVAARHMLSQSKPIIHAPNIDKSIDVVDHRVATASMACAAEIGSPDMMEDWYSFIPPSIIAAWARDAEIDDGLVAKLMKAKKRPTDDEVDALVNEALNEALYVDSDGPATPLEMHRGMKEPPELLMYALPLVLLGEDPEAPEPAETDDPTEELEKALTKWSLIYKGQQPPGGGWEPIPHGRHGGYRRRRGSGWEYWYPDGNSARAAKDHHAKQAEVMRKKLGRVLRKRGATQEQIEHFLDAYDTHLKHATSAEHHAAAADSAAAAVTTKDHNARLYDQAQAEQAQAAAQAKQNEMAAQGVEDSSSDSADREAQHQQQAAKAIAAAAADKAAKQAAAAANGDDTATDAESKPKKPVRPSKDPELHSVPAPNKGGKARAIEHADVLDFYMTPAEKAYATRLKKERLALDAKHGPEMYNWLNSASTERPLKQEHAEILAAYRGNAKDMRYHYNAVEGRVLAAGVDPYSVDKADLEAGASAEKLRRRRAARAEKMRKGRSPAHDLHDAVNAVDAKSGIPTVADRDYHKTENGSSIDFMFEAEQEFGGTSRSKRQRESTKRDVMSAVSRAQRQANWSDEKVSSILGEAMNDVGNGVPADVAISARISTAMTRGLLQAFIPKEG